MLVLAMFMGAATPLKDGRARQAATYVDGSHPDQPALYALLADVAEWEGGPSDEAGAVIVDWSVVLDRPADWRGAKVLVEGTDAGRRRRVTLVREQPPWGGAVTEWGIGVEAAETGEVQPMVVWFFDPHDAIPDVHYGRTVRVAGRFLGLWRDVDANGAERAYPVVVARSVRVVAGAGGAGLSGSGLAVAMVGAVLALGVLWRLSKAWGRVDVVGRRRAARRSVVGEADEDQDEPDDALPEDAGEALEVLAGGEMPAALDEGGRRSDGSS